MGIAERKQGYNEMECGVVGVAARYGDVHLTKLGLVRVHVV